jgi:hypothetical protein
MSDKIYRVTIKTTNSKQPSGTFWNREVAYCGPSLRDARVAYLREEASDHGGGYGNRYRETIIEAFDAEPEEIDDREPVEIDE